MSTSECSSIHSSDVSSSISPDEDENDNGSEVELNLEVIDIQEQEDYSSDEDHQASNGDSEGSVEPDSLGDHSSDEGDNIVGAIEGATPVLRHKHRRLPSRASLDSQRSISYFVDLNDGEEDEDDEPQQQDMMTQSAIYSMPETMSSQRYVPEPLSPESVAVPAAAMRMTQSMYTSESVNNKEPQVSSRSSSRQSQAISFFVDFSPPATARSSNSATPGRRRQQQPPSPSSSSRRIPRSAGAYRPSSSKANSKADPFFQKIKEHLETFNGPCFSKEEVKQRKKLAERIGQLLAEEEEKLGHGKALSDPNALDEMISDSSNGNSRRPTSAYYINEQASSSARPKGGSAKSGTERVRPVLRRERTFDLDPGTSARDAQVVEIMLDDSPVTPTSGMDKTLSRQQKELLQTFQQQRAQQVKALKREVEKLEQIERELAMKTSVCGPEPVECWGETQRRQHHHQPMIKSLVTPPVPAPRPRTLIPTLASRLPVPQRPARRCDSFSGKSPSSSATAALQSMTSSKRSSMENLTTFATSRDVKKEKFLLSVRERGEVNDVMTSSTPCSWFIPNGEEEAAAAALQAAAQTTSLYQETGNALFRRFHENKEKRKNKKVEVEPQAYFFSCDDEESCSSSVSRPPQPQRVRPQSSKSNLQEALQQCRPDYIERTKSREHSRLAKKMVSAERGAIVENISTDYGNNSNGRRSVNGASFGVSGRQQQHRELAVEDHQRPRRSGGGGRNPLANVSLLPDKSVSAVSAKRAVKKPEREEVTSRLHYNQDKNNTPAARTKQRESPIPRITKKQDDYARHQDRSSPRMKKDRAEEIITPSRHSDRFSPTPRASTTSTRLKSKSSLPTSYGSPYGSSRSTAVQGSGIGVPRVLLNNPSKELKRKETGGYKTNRAMSPLACGKSGGSVVSRPRVKVP